MKNKYAFHHHFQILMSVRILRSMIVMRPMDYALIPMDPISVAVIPDTVGMESPALVSQPNKSVNVMILHICY